MTILKLILLAVSLVLLLPTPAYAYLDPGVGSMMLQGLAAAVIGLGLFWRRILAKLKDIFQRKQ